MAEQREISRASALRRAVLLLLAAAGGIALQADEARAQYFGRNQVQYEMFDFEVLESEHFDVYYYEQEDEAATQAARMAERWYARLSRLLDHSFQGQQPFILYADHPSFSQTTALTTSPGTGTGGVTEPLKRRIVMPMAGPLGETDHVIGHELVHGFQFDMTGISPRSPLTGTPAISALPLWMVEGMAEYLSVGQGSALTAMWMRDAMLREDRDLPTARELANSRKYFPYRYGHSLWAYIGGRWGDEPVREIFLQTARTGSPAQAIGSVLQIPLDTLSADWHQAIRDAYRPITEATMPPDSFGSPMLTEETVGGETNLGASLSPNGEKVAFLNERSRFSIDLYVADTETGEILQQLTETAVDPHFQSLQFINSAGAWAPDNRRLAVAAIRKGDPILTVFDTETGSRVREFQLAELGEAFNPTWSPDGDRIAFVANDGGYMDLYVLDVETGEVRALTDDPWTELHPDWSPEGDRIAFVTDRFGGELDVLDYGNYELATIAPDGTELQLVQTFPDGRNTNPQWSPDGESLYFVSARSGIPNVYRHDLASGANRQITNVRTGVSGITELSPALTVAEESGKMAFSVFQAGAYNVYSVSDEERLAGMDLQSLPGDTEVSMLPPQTGREDGRLATLLDETRLGLPAAETFVRRDYNPSLSLSYISQPSLGASVSSYGSFIGGGASLFFSDMLGYHSLTTQVQLQIQDGNVLNGIGLLGQYVNQKHRTNWGVAAGQIPDITQGFRQGGIDTDGDGRAERFLRETITFWQINRQAVGLVRYPFSEVQRIEFSAGFNQIDFELETDQQVFDLRTRERIADTTFSAVPCGDSLSFRRTLCEPGTLNEAVASAALVYDNSLSGPTGPIMGQRYRIEATPSVGTLNYLSARADYRRYVMPFNPLTLAGRLMHFGRWGSDARDERLSRLFLGYPQLIRGYSSGSFDVRACGRVPLEECQELEVFSELFGTRIAVGNVEARLPLLGPLGTLSKVGNVPPIDLIGFFDAGVAWSSNREGTATNEQAFFFGGDRDLLTSAGAGLRVNLFGFALGEVHWVYPFDRPQKGGHFQFAINTGF